jgi:demethylmenaquinone methyltransferase/2-methoxy-6-polyprenyl-1,4-benzoquinol methylase
VASGFGQDSIELTRRGVWAVGAEPSSRMTALARMQAEKNPGRDPWWVRSWADALPFSDDSFDGAICKGALDHFDRPDTAIAEMARVTRPGGRVVLAVANFDSFSCRAARGIDAIQEGWLKRALPRGRRHYDVPSDHFTRYELDLMREHASRSLVLEVVLGISMAWGLPGWSRSVDRLPDRLAQATLEMLDGLARRLPGLSDVVILAGRPLDPRAASTISS